jgi:hypothetical protein
MAEQKLPKLTTGVRFPSPAPASPPVAQFTAARRIINGTDQNRKIAGEAQKFQAALQAGGW